MCVRHCTKHRKVRREYNRQKRERERKKNLREALLSHSCENRLALSSVIPVSTAKIVFVHSFCILSANLCQ